MSTSTRLVEAGADEVWKVLADGWLYPVFVVGATRMRGVDDHWPRVGARLHHSVGSWPAMVDDSTSVLESEPPSLLKLRARAWPAGEAEVTFHLRPRGPETEVILVEDAVSGPIRLVPKVLRDPPLDWRNVETLRRLAFIAEGRHS